MKILYILLTAFLITCTKEYSGEGTPVVVDTIPNPVDTIPVVPKTFIIKYNIPVDSNYKLSHIEPEFKSKYREFYDFYVIGKVDDSVRYTYTGEYDATDPMDVLKKGDTGFIRYAFVWMDRTFTYTEITDTIIK